MFAEKLVKAVIIKRLEVREMGRIRWVGIGVFLALLVIGLSRSAFAKGPPDKVIVQGPGLSGEVEITDPRRLQAFGFFQFEDISQRVDPPSDPGPGYVITRYVRDPARGWIAWNRLIYYPPRGGRPGVVWAEGLSVTTNYDGFWYAVSAEGERVMEEILHERGVRAVRHLRSSLEQERARCPVEALATCSDLSGELPADLSGALRLVLGGVLLRAFVAKARVPRRFIEAIRAYALLPPGIAPIAAGGLLLAEPVLALALLTGWGGALAWDATVLLLGLFLIAVAVNLRRGRQIPCGCFGSASETISYHTLARLVLLELAALVARLLHPAYPDLSIARAGAAAALAALLLVGGLWLLELPSWIRLFRRPISPQER
jgi:hypothetical protein